MLVCISWGARKHFITCSFPASDFVVEELEGTGGDGGCVRMAGEEAGLKRFEEQVAAGGFYR